MSRTDKDRPHWVVQHVEGFPIEHDHRSGRCLEETLDYARANNAGTYKRNWQHKCLKRVVTEYYCTKEVPYKPYRTWRKGKYTREEDLCWNEWEVPVVWVGTRYPGHKNGFLYRTKHTECLGPHTRYDYYDTIPCVCNSWPPVPTCDPAYYAPGRNPSGRGVAGCPSWYVSAEYHRPERARTRNALADAKKWRFEDLEDFDLPERQGRNNCSYHWN